VWTISSRIRCNFEPLYHRLIGIHSVHIRFDSVFFRLVEIQEDVRSEIRVVDEISVFGRIYRFDFVDLDPFRIPPGEAILVKGRHGCSDQQQRYDEV